MPYGTDDLVSLLLREHNHYQSDRGLGEVTDWGGGVGDDVANVLTEHPSKGAHQVMAANIAAWITTCCVNSLCSLYVLQCYVCVPRMAMHLSNEVPGSAYSASRCCREPNTKHRSREGLLFFCALLSRCRDSMPLRDLLQRVV